MPITLPNFNSQYELDFEAPYCRCIDFLRNSADDLHRDIVEGGPPFRVTKTLKTLQIPVHISTEGDITNGGMLSILPSGAYLIYVGSQSRINTQRFRVAHEFGHILLNEHGGTFTSNGCGSKSCEVEKACNMFAARFLMPDRDFTETISLDLVSGGLAVALGLSTIYQISVQATALRLRDLGWGWTVFSARRYANPSLSECLRVAWSANGEWGGRKIFIPQHKSIAPQSTVDFVSKTRGHRGRLCLDTPIDIKANIENIPLGSLRSMGPLLLEATKIGSVTWAAVRVQGAVD